MRRRLVSVSAATILSLTALPCGTTRAADDSAVLGAAVVATDGVNGDVLDLALGAPGNATHGLFLVAPDDREEEVRAQLGRPAFRAVSNLAVRYLPYGELEKHRDAMARFGAGLKAIEAIARTLV